jgi:hypothetical protein
MKHLFFLAAGIVVLLMPGRTWAHALGAQWRIEGDTVFLEAYFSDGTPAQEASVEIYHDGVRTSADSAPLLTLRVKTDAKGACSFSVSSIGEVDGVTLSYPSVFRIVVDAGAGHRKELARRIRKPPAKVATVIRALGPASFGGMEPLSMGAALAPVYSESPHVSRSEENTDRAEDPTKEEFTSYPWGSVVIVVGCLSVIALVIWILRGATTAV